MSTTVTYKGNTLTTVNNATKTLKTAGKYMEDDVTLVDDSKPTYTDVENSAGGRTITVNNGVITTGSKVAHILPTGMYDLPSDATITNESNMYTTVDSETYATILSKSFPSVGYFDFSVLPDNAIVKSFELLFKTASGTNINRLNQSQVLYFGQQSALNNTTALPFRQNPEITSIDLEGVTWNDIISNKSVLNLVIPSSDDSDYRYYGIEFRVTYDLPVNKVVYGTTSLVDLTADTVTPADLALGTMAHDASGATIEGTFYLQDYLDITPTEDSQYFDPSSSASRGELIENREISIEKISGLNINTELNSALGNVTFNTAGVYFVGEIEITCNYIVQGSTLFSGTTTVYIDGASTMGERGWISAYDTTSYSGDGDAYRISGILAKGSSSHLTTITCTGQNTNAYYYYDISGWLDTYSSPIASGFRMVNVSAIPSEYIIPTGTKSISANGTGIDVAQYANVDVAVEDSTLVVTLSYNESTEMWEPDKTYAEIQAAHQNGKTIVLISENNEALGTIFEFGNDYVFYNVDVPFNEPTNISGNWVSGVDSLAYNLTQDGIFMTGSVRFYEMIHANATATDVTSGKLFYGPNGLTLGTLSEAVPSLQSKTAIPTESAQTIMADSGYDGLSQVDIDAISSTYVGSGIDRYGSIDAVVDKESVGFPAGYYAEEHHGEVAIGTVSEQNLSVESVGHGEYAVRATVNVTEGYVPNDTKTDRLNLASYLQTKTITPTESAQHAYPDSGKIGLFDVMVEAIPSDYIGSEITQRSSTDLTASSATVTVPAGYYSTQASKTVASGSATINSRITTTPSISIDEDGLVTADLNGSVGAMPVVTEGYITAGTTGSISYIGSKTLQLDTQAAATITPTEESQTAVVAGKYTIGAVTVGAIPSTYVGSGITQRTSSDLTTSGATVTVPAGYYNEVASKSVETITYNKSNNSVGTLWDSINATPTMQYLNFSKGYLSEDKYIRVWTSSGSATAPTSITGTAATVSTGTNTLTLTKSVSVTPSVTAGYVSSGTAGNSSVSLTANVTTKAAATITPGTTNQTIAAGTYLTGTQTIAGDADLIADNIISTANIFGVQGNVVVQNYYTGSSVPSSSLGQNGDIYLQG